MEILVINNLYTFVQILNRGRNQILNKITQNTKEI